MTREETRMEASEGQVILLMFSAQERSFGGHSPHDRVRTIRVASAKYGVSLSFT